MPRRRRPSIRSRREHIGQDTPLPSIELSIEPLNLNCGDAGYTCAYSQHLSWKTATLPLPMENNPQVVFERLFGDGSTDAQRQDARDSRRAACSTRSATRCRRCENGSAGRATARGCGEYLDDVREIERRIQQVDAQLSSELDAARCAGRASRRRSRSTSS